MARPSVIDGYLSELGSRLRGPAPVRADLLSEARDGLVDAAEGYRAAGLSEPAAQRRAVADFGPVAVVARAYQGELAVAHAVRTLRVLLLVIALGDLVWLVDRIVWSTTRSGVAGPAPDWYLVAAQASDMTAAAIALGVVAVLVGSRWLYRTGMSSVEVGRLVGAFTVGALGTYVFCVLTLAVATALRDLVQPAEPVPVVSLGLGAVAGPGAVVVVAWLVVQTRRCLDVSGG